MEMIGGVKKSDKPGRRRAMSVSAPLAAENVFAALAPAPAPKPEPPVAPAAPARVRPESDSENDDAFMDTAATALELDDLIKKIGKSTIKKSKVEKVLDQLGATETEAIVAAASRKKRERKAPEVYKPTEPTPVVRKETKKVRAAAITPKKEPGVKAVTPKKEPGVKAVKPPKKEPAAATPRADLGATDDIPKCFNELIQTHETYDPKLKNYRYELHKGNASVIPLAEAYQGKKLAAAQLILEQELKNMESLKKLILVARERAAAAPPPMDLAGGGAERRARPSTSAAPPAPAEEDRMVEGGARRKSGKKEVGCGY